MPASNPTHNPPYNPSYERGGGTGGVYQSGAQPVYHAGGVNVFGQASGGPQYGREGFAPPPHAGLNLGPCQGGSGPGVLHGPGQGGRYGPAGPHAPRRGFP